MSPILIQKENSKKVKIVNFNKTLFFTNGYSHGYSPGYSPVYSVIWDSSDPSPILTRADDAVGMSIADFDGTFFGDIRRCNQSDNGNINAYYGQSAYKTDGSNGQVMVEIPGFYYRVLVEGSLWKWSVTARQRPGFLYNPFCMRNGVMKKRIYVGAFQACFYDVSGGEYANYYVGAATPNTDDSGDAYVSPTGITPDYLNDKLASVAGFFPVTKMTIVENRQMAHNRGPGWELLDFLTYSAAQLLATIEYANFNFQTQLGQGITGKTWDPTMKAEAAGQTTGNGSYGITTDGLHAVSYRGIENFFGNSWQWIDGINIKADHDPWVADHGFESDKFEPPYSQLGLSLPSSNGYVSKLQHNSNFDFGFLPLEVAESSSSYLCDYHYQSAGNRVALVGGGWDSSGGHAGPFFWDLHGSSAGWNLNVGARLMKV